MTTKDNIIDLPLQTRADGRLQPDSIDTDRARRLLAVAQDAELGAAEASRAAVQKSLDEAGLRELPGALRAHEEADIGAGLVQSPTEIATYGACTND